MSDYHEAFLRESREQITELNNALLALESDPGDGEAMDAVFRTAHTLKGNAAAMGFDGISEVAHAVEDLLDEVRNDRLDVTPERMDLTFAGVDRIETALGDLEEHGEVEMDASALAADIRAAIDGEADQGNSDGGGGGDDGATGDGGPDTDGAADGADDADADDAVADDADDDADDAGHDDGEGDTEGGEAGESGPAPTGAVLDELSADPSEFADPLVHAWIAVDDGGMKGVDAMLVFDALTDSIDVLATLPDREAIESGEFDGGFDLLVGGESVETLEAIFEELGPVTDATVAAVGADADPDEDAEPSEDAEAGEDSDPDRDAEADGDAEAREDAEGEIGDSEEETAVADPDDGADSGDSADGTDGLDPEGDHPAGDHPADDDLAGEDSGSGTTGTGDAGDGQPGGGGAGGGGPGASVDDVKSVRVDVDQLDELHGLVEQLVTSRIKLRRALEDEQYADARDSLGELDKISTHLQDTVMDMQLVPLRKVVGKFPRLVRDLARDQGKEVNFRLEGEEIELDRTILTRISDPLMHILRNAVDHGIEPPEEREAADKPREGTVELRARREGDHVFIVVEDDGRGLDVEAIREKAAAEGIRSQRELTQMEDDDVYDLVFHPGFSTNDEVTDVSGRGVGMDVVHSTVKRLDGSVDVRSERGEGTTVTLRLPVTVAIVTVLFVRVGGQRFGVPLKAIDEVGRATDIRTTNGREVVEHDDDLYPVIRLADALEVAGPAEQNGDGMLVRIRESERQAVLYCDTVEDQAEVVVKPLEGILSGTQGMSGTAVLGDGNIVPILDVMTV